MNQKQFLQIIITIALGIASCIILSYWQSSGRSLTEVCTQTECRSVSVSSSQTNSSSFLMYSNIEAQLLAQFQLYITSIPYHEDLFSKCPIHSTELQVQMAAICADVCDAEVTLSAFIVADEQAFDFLYDKLNTETKKIGPSVRPQLVECTGKVFQYSAELPTGVLEQIGDGSKLTGFRHFVVVVHFAGKAVVFDPTITQFRFNGRLPPAVLCVGRGVSSGVAAIDAIHTSGTVKVYAV